MNDIDGAIVAKVTSEHGGVDFEILLDDTFGFSSFQCIAIVSTFRTDLEIYEY